MRDKWYIPVLLFVILVIGYIARGFVETRITLEMLQTDKIEEVSACVGVLVKTEHTATLPTDGVTEIVVKDGQRVAKGEMIATVYNSAADESVKAQLAEVNKRIYAMEVSRADDAVFFSDATIIESTIAKNVDEVIALATEYDMESIAEYKYRFSTMADQKAVAKGEKETFTDQLTRLRAEKSVLESQFGKIESVALSPIPGIFVEGHDGFETELTKESAEFFTPDTVNDVIYRERERKIAETEGNVYSYKIVDNYSYMVAVNLQDSFCGNLKVGDNTQIRFSDLSGASYPAKIVHISEPNAKGIRAVVVECRSHVEGLLDKRIVNVDFIRKSVSGYKVDTEYLHTVDNKVGLFIKRGAVMKFIPVTVVYSTEHEAIVAAESASAPIKPYDEVVVSAPEFANGKVIVSQ